ncbi:hypothetical protein EON68_00165, partial [archaeon]
MFGTKARYCAYTELLFCGRCMSPAPRPLPWRIVQEGSDMEYPVCRAAADFIDSIWNLPTIALSAVAPEMLANSPHLLRIMQLRARLASVTEAVTIAASAAAAAQAAAAAWAPDEKFKLSIETSMVSTAVSPIQRAALESEAAASVHATLASICSAALGQHLAFMWESVELMPLSLILLAATRPGASKIVTRLSNAVAAVERYAAEKGMDAALMAGATRAASASVASAASVAADGRSGSMAAAGGAGTGELLTPPPRGRSAGGFG